MSTANTQIKKGDKIVDYGRVFNVYKITKEKTFDGEREDHIFYEPLFPGDKYQSLKCSLPKSKFEEARIRKVTSKTKLLKALKKLSSNTRPKKVTTLEVEEILNKSNPFETAKLVSLLWALKKSEDFTLTVKNKMLMENAIRSLTEELALANNISLEKAKASILRRLKG